MSRDGCWFNLPDGGTATELEVTIPVKGQRKCHATIMEEYDALRDALEAEEKQHGMHYHYRLPERLRSVLEMHGKAARDAMSGAQSFRDDALVMLRSIAFVIETALSASTHREKDARLRGVNDVVERHIHELRQLSFNFRGDCWRRGYDGFRWNEQERWLRERVRELESAKKSAERPRFSGCDPQTVLPCENCKEVKPTTIGEVWCEADPTGRLVRVCAECEGGFAAG